MPSTIFPPSALSAGQVFGEPQLHTDGDITALTFIGDGSLWSVEEPGVLRRWDAATGQQLQWHDLSDLETVWAFSRDGRLLASASSTGSLFLPDVPRGDDLTLWDVSSGDVITAIRQESWVTALAFGKDSAFLATGHDDGVIRYWDAEAHYRVHELHLHKKPISALAISNDGKVLAAACEDKTISLWDTATGKKLGKLSGHTDRIPALAFHPSGTYLVSAGWDATARVWNVRAQEPVILLNSHNPQVTALAFSDDGTLLATADSGPSVHIWDFDSRKTLHQLQGPRAEIRCLAFSSDNNNLACSGDRLIHLWDTKTGEPRAGGGARVEAKTSVAVSPDGRFLASNGGGSSAGVWDIVTGKLIFTLGETGIVHSLAYSPDGKLIAAAAESHISLWDAASGKFVRDLSGFEEVATNLAFSPDGATLAMGSYTGLDVWLWRVADGEPIFIMDDVLDGCTVESIAFHPAGRLVAVGGIDWMATGVSSGAISIWDLQDRVQIGEYILDGTSCIAFHPSGAHLASTSLDQSICIWSTDTREIESELRGHEGAVTCIAYSPDGQWLASGSEDRTVRLWDQDGLERAALEVDSQVTGLTFSADGQYLYTANANTTSSRIKLSDLLKD